MTFFIQKNLKTALGKKHGVDTAWMVKLLHDSGFDQPYFGNAQMRIVMESSQTFLVLTKLHNVMLYR